MQNNPSGSKERKYLTAVMIVGGIITLLDDNGMIVYYRQRGIKNIPDEKKRQLINIGMLHKNWEQYKELPKEISIRFEDESIMGKARATFPNLAFREL